MDENGSNQWSINPQGAWAHNKLNTFAIKLG